MSTKIIAQLNPFSSEKKIWNEDDSSINEIIKKIDCQNAVNAGWRILLNDEIITDFSTVTHDGDTLYIKIVPEGDSPKELGAGEKIAGGLITALGVAALFIPGLGPAVGIALIGSGIGLFANGCVMYNLDLSQKDRESPVQDPSIRGSKNQIRQYGNIPVLFGKRRIYPDLATTAYTWVENGQQYLYQLFCCGQKNQTIDTSTIKIGETLLTDYSSSGNIEDVLSGDDSLIQMQIAYGENTPPLLTKCVHEDILNTVLKHQTEDELDGSIIRTTPENTTEINVDIFFYNGLGQYNDDGDVEDCSVTVKAWYKRSDQDDSYYVQLGHFASDDVITEHELKTKRFSIHKTGLTANSYTVKIERVTEDSDDSKIVDQCYVGSIRAIKNESPVSSARCRQLTLIGLKIKSSEKLNNYIEQLNFISQSSLPCYSGTGSGALQWNNAISSNPASAAIYAMQGEVSQQKLNNSEIDWPAFEKLYTWCNQHEYECNEYITDSMSISELLSSIGSTCRAEIFRQNGKITVIQDIERDGFVQLFTPRNSWDYEESIEMPDIPDAMALGFVDEEAGYVKQEAKIYNTSNGEKISEPETTQDVTLWGVTSSKQARKLGMYKYAVSRARPIVHKFSADFEYMLCGKGDWIKYAGDIALAGITQGRIASLIINGNTITGFTSDEQLPMEDGQSYAVRIRENDGSAILKNIESHSEDCMTVYFDTAVSLNVLHEGDLFTFGYVGNDSIDLIITDIHCGDNLSAEIIAVEYSPEIFAVDDSGFVLPTFINRITEIPSIEDSGQLSDIEEPVKIVTTSILYAASSNGVTPPATGWDSSIPTVSPGNFLWTQTKVFYTDNKSTVSYSVAKQGATGATGPQGAKGDKGDNGQNAVTMTSPSTPSGTYNGQIGVYKGVIYQWNGSSWEEQSLSLPTDAILHYSFDDVPDLPDGNAVWRKNNDFDTTSDWRGSGTASLSNGKLVINFSETEQYKYKSISISNQILKVKFKANTSGMVVWLTVRPSGASSDATLQTYTTVSGEEYTYVNFLSGNYTNINFFCHPQGTTGSIEIEQIYIGDGSFNTQVLDNSGNSNFATNVGGLATDGICRKGIRFVGTGSCNANIPQLTNFSISTWINHKVFVNTYPHIAIVAGDWWIYFNNLTGLAVSIGGKFLTAILSNDKWHNIIMTVEGMSVKLYINGVLVSTTTLTSRTTGTALTIGNNMLNGNRGINGEIDDFQLYNRVLSDKEVLGLYLARGNTLKNYTQTDYELDLINRLPTDPVLHYSFDEVPDLPDRTSLIARNKNFSDISEIIALRSTPSITNGVLKLQQNTTSVQYGVGMRMDSDSVSVVNKIVKCKVYASVEGVNTVTFLSSNHVDNTRFYTQTVETNKWIELSFVLPNNANNPWLAFTGFTSSLDNYILFEQVYIGDGLYSTQVIDNAGGKYNATNNGTLATQGVSGKGIKGMSGKYLGLSNFNFPQNYTISVWFNPSDNESGKQNDIIAKYSEFILRNGATWSNRLMCYQYGEDGTEKLFYLTSNALTPNEWQHLVVIKNNATLKYYNNGILVYSGVCNETQKNVTGTFSVFNLSSTRDSMVDDLQIFNRALSDIEILALYNNRGNTPKKYIESDYRFDCIDNDGIITPSEKKTLLSKWLEIYNQKNVTSALTYNISDNTSGEYVAHIKSASSSSKGASVTQVANYINATNSIRNAMWGTNGILLDMASNSNVNAGDIDSLYATYGKCKEDLEFICRNTTTNITNNNYEYNTTGEYLGKKTSAPSISNVNKCDFFLANGISGYDTGYIYYKADHSSTSWTKDTNTSSGRYVQAMADLLTIANSTGANNFSQLLASYTAFINTLSSSSAFIQNLFANFITIGKLIKTDNFNGSYDSQGNITSEGTTGFAFSKNGDLVANDISLRGLLETGKSTESRVLLTYSGIDLTSPTEGFIVASYCNASVTNVNTHITMYTSNCDPYIKIYVNVNGTRKEVSRIEWMGYWVSRTIIPPEDQVFGFYDANNNLINEVLYGYPENAYPIEIRYVLNNERCLKLNIPTIPMFLNPSRKELFSIGGLIQTGDSNPFIKVRYEVGTPCWKVYSELSKYINTKNTSAQTYLTCMGQFQQEIAKLRYSSSRIDFYDAGNNIVLNVTPLDTNILPYRLVLAFIYTKDV